MKRFTLTFALTLSVLPGCASDWKIQGGPKECREMCSGWGLEFAGMVGVGNQDRTGNGATACVCQVAPKVGSILDKTGASASLAAPITAAQAAVAAQMASQQQMAAQQAAAQY